MIISRFYYSIILLTTLVAISTAQFDDTNDDVMIKKRLGAEEVGSVGIVSEQDNESKLKRSDMSTNESIKDHKNKGRQVGTSGVNKKGRKNTELLQKVGLAKMKTPAINHHRKRLASQSRKAQPGDSHMFVIKLPPNPYYYAHSKPLSNSPSKFDNNAFETKEQIPALGASWNKVGLDFPSNGKPSRIYHWNIPVMKKMMIARKTSGDKTQKDTMWDPISEQSTLDSDNDDFIHHKVSYYKPKKPSKKTFNKYFAGNGKPHSFYVIDKSRKPVSYHRLMP